MMMKEMVLSEVTLLLGSYPDPANSTSKYSDSVLGGNCLLGYALLEGFILSLPIDIFTKIRADLDYMRCLIGLNF